MKYGIFNDVSDKESQFLLEKLVEYSDQFTEPRNFSEFSLVVRNTEGEVSGGITGSIVWDWLQISVLWVSEELRGLGYGKQLLEDPEKSAKKKGCKYAKLDTFEFEASGFYEKQGYSVYSQLNNFPSGYTHFYMSKTL